MTGTFITFEGPDGAGKTSVLKALLPQLQQMIQTPIVLTREPGGNPISEAIRHLILDPANTEMDARTEALLYTAARRQHIMTKIRPALAAGKIVICDRFVDSSLAYQGAGRQIGVAAVAQMNQFATEGLTPDVTIYLDIPSELGLQRIATHRQQQNDRLDQEDLTFHQTVRQAYLQLAQTDPQRIKVIDASQTLTSVIAASQAALKQALPTLF